MHARPQQLMMICSDWRGFTWITALTSGPTKRFIHNRYEPTAKPHPKATILGNMHHWSIKTSSPSFVSLLLGWYMDLSSSRYPWWKEYSDQSLLLLHWDWHARCRITKGDENKTRRGRKQEVSTKPFTHIKTRKPERQKERNIVSIRYSKLQCTLYRCSVATTFLSQIIILLQNTDFTLDFKWM